MKVALPTDSFNTPSFELSVRTRSGAQIEPIDSLYTLFKAQQQPCSSIGLIESPLFDEQFTLFPNPSSDRINIKANNAKASTVQLLNHLGQEVLSDQFNRSTQIDISTLPSGTYFAIIIQDGEEWIKKIIVQ